jgi:hypothetical protein
MTSGSPGDSGHAPLLPGAGSPNNVLKMDLSVVSYAGWRLR